MAQKLGYFEEAGLDVSIDTPSDPAAPLKLVAAGQSDLAISYEPEVALAHEKGLDVIAIGALVNRPLTSLIWLGKSGIKGVADLKGKTVATAGIPYQEAFLKTILSRAHLSPDDVKEVNVGFGLLPALLGGSADAMLGGYSNVEGVDLSQRGKDPVITPVDQLGVPTYDELVLVANREALAEDPDKFRLFIAALERGTDAAVKQPKAATAGDPRGQRRARPETDRSRGRSDAAAARGPYRRASPTATWTRRVGHLRRLDARQRPDRVAAGSRASCSATPTSRAISPNSRVCLRRAAG